MFITIGSKLYIENPTLSIIDYCENQLTLTNPDYITATRLGKNTRRMKKTLDLYEVKCGDYLLPFGCLKDIYSMYPENSAYKNTIKPLQAIKCSGSVNLYPYQQNALNDLIRAKNGVLVAPCGSGKTEIAVALIKALSGKTLWLTHTSDLLTQSKKRVERYLKCNVGTITDGKVNIGDITFATIQTMAKLDLLQYYDMFSVIIVDECQKVSGSPTRVKQFYKVLSHLCARYKYGLTATPNRADNLIESMFALLGGIVHTISESETNRIKAQYEPLFIKAPLEKGFVGQDIITGQNIYKLPYIDTDGTIIYSKLMETISNNEWRNNYIKDLATTCIKNDKHTLILCNLVSQAKTLHSAIVGSELLIGSVSRGKREETLQRAKQGTTKCVVATYSLAKEGLDIPILDTLILASPQKDFTTIKQSVGRIERQYAGKQSSVVYDIVDSNIPYCLGSYKKRKGIITK